MNLKILWTSAKKEKKSISSVTCPNHHGWIFFGSKDKRITITFCFKILGLNYNGKTFCDLIHHSSHIKQGTLSICLILSFKKNSSSEQRKSKLIALIDFLGASDCIAQRAAKQRIKKKRMPKPCALVTKADLWKQLSKSLVALQHSRRIRKIQQLCCLMIFLLVRHILMCACDCDGTLEHQKNIAPGNVAEWILQWKKQQGNRWNENCENVQKWQQLSTFLWRSDHHGAGATL